MKFQNLDTGRPIEAIDGYTKFFLPDPSGAVDDDRRKTCLSILQQSWPGYKERFIASDAPDIVWADSLDSYLLGEAEARIKYIKTWLDVNTNRFSAHITTFAGLHHQFESTAVSLKANVKLCKMQCAACQLVCIQPHHHDGPHDCETSHRCSQTCSFINEHGSEMILCGLP
jgi:hypothetical protein